VYRFFIKFFSRQHPSTAAQVASTAQQTFILDPILTPSGLVDSLEEAPSLPLPEIDLFDPMDGVAKAETETIDSIPDVPMELESDLESASDPLELIGFIDSLDAPAATLTNASPVFDSGVFTVGENGEVSIDFLFDGGRYEGEVSIFSLAGMEDFEPGSEAFIREAASRSLSHSEQGYIVIADRIEGARFEGTLGERFDWSDGQYLGVKTVEMRPGDEFGIMLVPNGSVQQVFDNPRLEGNLRPLFSMATANPEDAFHVGQIADVTGDGDTFVLEDWRVDEGSDLDYNDIVFQIKGATGEAVDLDDVIDPSQDWRDLDFGQDILDFAKNGSLAPEVESPVDDLALSSGRPTATIDLSQVFIDADSDSLEFEIVDGDGEVVDLVLQDDRLQLTQRGETGLANVAIRVTDETGNSYIHSFTVANSRLSNGQLSALNVALARLGDAIAFDRDDLTVGLSSPDGEDAIARLGSVLQAQPGLSELLSHPDLLAQIGVTPAGVNTLQQVLESPQLAADLDLGSTEGVFAAPATLADALSDSSSPLLDLYQIGATGIASALANPEMNATHPLYRRLAESTHPRIGILDFPARGHRRQVVETLTQVNPLAEYRTLDAGSHSWAEQLVKFVEEVKQSGQANGIVNLSLDLSQIDGQGRITTRYELTVAEQQAIQYALEHNVLLVVAAGNTGDQMSALGAAAQVFDNIVTVGAIDVWGQRADYSSRGQGLSLVAPGGEFQGEHNAFAGTSKATAYVTAAASLVWAANPDLNYQQVKQLLTDNALDLDVPGWDAETGAGVLNVEAAVRQARQTAPETLTSVGELTLEFFSGTGRVTPLARAASPATEAAIADLLNQQSSLDAQRQQLVGTGTLPLSLAQLEAAVAQQTAAALAEFQQIRNRAAIIGSQTGQASVALDLATQHHQIEERRLVTIEGRQQNLTQQLFELNQQQTALEEARQQQLAAMNDQIQTAQAALQAIQQEHQSLVQQRLTLPPVELRQQAAQYRDSIQSLAAERERHRAIAASQQVLKDRHLHQASLAERTRLTLEPLVAQLVQMATLLETNASPAVLTAGYQQLASLAQQLQQQSQANADWHQERLEQVPATPGWTGILTSAQRAEHSRQRDLYQQLASQAATQHDAASFLSGSSNAQLAALERTIAAHETQLQAEQDGLALYQAKTEQQLAAIAFQIAQAEATLQALQTQQPDAVAAAAATEQRLLDLRTQLESLQSDWDASQSQWNAYLRLNRSFLPEATRQTLVDRRLQDLDTEEARVRALMLEIQQQLTQTPNATLRSQLDDVAIYLEELTQERLLAQLHQDRLDGSALSSPARSALLEQTDQLEQTYQPLQAQWQVAFDEREAAAAALAATQALGTTERQELADLRSQLASAQPDLATAQTEQNRLTQERDAAQQALELAELQLTNQQLLLQSLLDRDAALANGEAFYYTLAEEQRQKLWYWNDRTNRYEYNDSVAEQYQSFLQHTSFLAGERNRTFQAMQEARTRIQNLQQRQSNQQTQVTTLAADLAAATNRVESLEAAIAPLTDAIAPLAAIVEPLLQQEERDRQTLATATAQTDAILAELIATANRQIAALERLINSGLLLAEEEANSFTTTTEPQIRQAIQQLRDRAVVFAAQGLDLGFGAAADRLEAQLVQAEQVVESLRSQQQLTLHQQLTSNASRLQALQTLLATEDAADAAIQTDALADYEHLTDTVRQDLQQSAATWSQQFQTSQQLAQDLVAEQQQLSNDADTLLNLIQTQFADPNGNYSRSETELQEALSILAIGAQRQDELTQAVSQTSQDIERLQHRLLQDASLWAIIAPIAARYGIDSQEQLQQLLADTLSQHNQQQQQLAAAKAKYAEQSAQAAAALSQTAWNEAQARIQWELSRKAGPTWTETRCGRRGKKSGCETIVHYDQHWIAWEQHESTAKILQEQGLNQLIEAEQWRQEIERLDPLAQQWGEANQAVHQADRSFTVTQTQVKQLETAQEDLPAAQAQLALLTGLLPELQQQLQQAEQNAQTANLTVQQAWTDYDPAAAAYRQALAAVLTQQGNWQQQATETQHQIEETEGWIEQQSVALGTELAQVLALKQQLESQQQILETQLLSTPSPEVINKLLQLDESLRLVTNKAAVLTAQQTALAQHRTLLTAQSEVIQAEQQLLAAVLKSPGSDTVALQQQLLDSRAALAEAQQLADQAKANSQALSAPLQQLQTDLLSQNAEHLQAAREQRNILADLLAATEQNIQYTLDAAQAQQRVNDLEFQIINRLQDATAAGSQEARHLLDVAQYNDIASAAELFFRDYSDLASDRGSKGVGTAEDAELAERYRQEMLRYRALQGEAQTQANTFQQLKEAAQAQLAALDAEQQQAVAALAQLNEQIASTDNAIATHQQALAIAEARADALARVRQQTEQTFVQLVTLEQINLSQAQFEQRLAQQRQDDIDQAVADRLERDRIALERQRLELQFQIEKLKQQQTEEDLRQALNQVRSDLSQADIDGTVDPAALQSQLTGLLAGLQALQNQQPDLPADLKVLLTEVQGDIQLALQGDEAQDIQTRLLQAANGLIGQVDQYKAEIAQIDLEEQRDQVILQTAQTNLQEASRMLLAELDRAQALQGEREIVNPLYLEALTKVAYAEQAVEISEALAKNVREALEEHIQQRIQQRKARKKAFWNAILGTISTVLSIVGTVLTFIPATTALGLALGALGGAIGTVQAAINGDWAGAIFSAVMAGASFVGGTIGNALKAGKQVVLGLTRAVAEKTLATIKTLQSLASGTFNGVRNILSGDSIMGFLQIIGGLASAATSGIAGFAQNGLQGLSNLGKFGYKILESLQTVPTLIYSSIKSIQSGDWINGIGNILKSAISLAKTWTNDFNDGYESPGERIANILENIGSVGIGVSKFISGGVNGLFDGLGDIASGLGDDIANFVERINDRDDCVCSSPTVVSEETADNANDAGQDTFPGLGEQPVLNYHQTPDGKVYYEDGIKSYATDLEYHVDPNGTVYYSDSAGNTYETNEFGQIVGGHFQIGDTNREGHWYSYQGKPIDPRKLTKVLIHGYRDSGSEDWVARDMTGAYSQQNPDQNIIVIDWGEAANGVLNRYLPLDYDSAAEASRKVGESVYQILNDQGIQAANTTLIGHSLGAQAVGAATLSLPAGVEYQHVIALDPAGPMFERGGLFFGQRPPADRRLDREDGNITAIHTTRWLGTAHAIGDRDFYLSDGVIRRYLKPTDYLKNVFGAAANHQVAYRWWIDQVAHGRDRIWLEQEEKSYTVVRR